MQHHDQQIADITAHIRHLCSQMSDAYIDIIFDDIELGLVSNHRVENILALNFLKTLSALPVGSALKVLKNVREDLTPVIRGKTITIRAIRSAGRLPIIGAEAWNAWVHRKQSPSSVPRDKKLKGREATFIAIDELETAGQA